MKGSFSEDALAAYQQALAERDGMDFAEGETYDFARCVRPDGSFYGTRGKCKKGKEAGEKSGDDVNELQNKASRGDKDAMKKLTEMRASGKIGKEPGFGPGAKARQETKEAKELGAAPARKPRASASELKASQEKLFDDAKAKRAAAREAEKAARQVAKETKGDKSPEARKKRLEAGRAWDKAATAADSAQRKWMKEYERWSKASGREEKAKMSPEQRKEQRNIDRVIRERG